MIRVSVVAAVATSAFGLFGCATSTNSPDHPVTGVTPNGTPKWVHRGSGAFDGDAGKAFYGVGITQGVRNIALANQSADNRARRQISELFNTYVAAMMKDYMRSTTAGDFKASSEEQDIVSAQKTLTESTLSGVEIREHWRDPQTGAYYALAVLQLDGMMKSLQKMKSLNAGVRNYVRANAARSFNDLDAELRKKSARGH